MKTLSASLTLCLSLLLLATAPGCQVQAQDALPYSCATDADCGEGGFTCVSAAGRANFCCQKAAETCNGADDDCDGTVDELDGEPCYEGPEATRGVGACRAGTPACGAGGSSTCADQVLPKAAETCNRVDDDCDGAVDEDFNLQTDIAHCGQCGRACLAGQACVSGQCTGRQETSCSDGADNDGDTLTDCDDDECLDATCGEGRACRPDKSCGEALCDNGANDDGDTGADCADSDCDGKSCNAAQGGCVCAAGVKKETDCNDNADNDGNSGADCADPDCGNACGAGCACQGPTKLETACSDGADNDNNGKTDCTPGQEDANCKDGVCGAGCKLLDCARLETVCDDGADNDGENGEDCKDPDCDGKSCNSARGGCTCTGAVATETLCGDGVNNDNREGTDCADVADCNTKSCGTGCVCAVSGTTGIAKETICNDGLNNDGREGIDCADTTDCPGGTVCRQNNGQSGVCGTRQQDVGKCV